MSPIDPFRLALWSLTAPAGNWLLSPGYNGPLLGPCPYVLTVHDLNHVDRPENSSVLKRVYYRWVLRGVCRRARAVLTVSEYSRQRLLDSFELPSTHVFNVGNGVSPSFVPEGPRHVEVGGYALCVSNRRGHKNEAGLLRAFALALPSLPTGRRLVLTGEPNDQVLQLIDQLKLKAQVRFAGRVSEQELAALYRGAEYLVFPSFYEGFGLPIVEAFASGTPVITSAATSMPEIAGDAALLVDPADTGSIADAMVLLDNSAELRARLRTRGLARAAEFTWDRVAQRVREAVQAVDTDPQQPLDWN